ncbi:hypothetical protein RchiOBHm_Chr7g0181031 [Rosa chinensis]|uniref:Uncharacterized protein n=1 Tax=Rosa chinensis TaxID=74649 RepID=A0A2P6P2I2_ROSCH|nr:hypothetical protein RchiOBHm_Chr7g0181031 [Rosa chinensis]
MKPPSRHHPPCAVIVKSCFKDSRSTSQALHHPLPSWWLNCALAFERITHPKRKAERKSPSIKCFTPSCTDIIYADIKTLRDPDIEIGSYSNFSLVSCKLRFLSLYCFLVDIFDDILCIFRYF